MAELDVGRLVFSERSLTTGATGVAMVLINSIFVRCHWEPLSVEESVAWSSALIWLVSMIAKIIKIKRGSANV